MCFFFEKPRNEVIPNHMQTTNKFLKSLFKTAYFFFLSSGCFRARFCLMLNVMILNFDADFGILMFGERILHIFLAWHYDYL